MASKKQVDPRVVVQREIGKRGSLADFVEMAWSYVEPSSRFYSNWHITAMCDHMQAIEEERLGYLIINVPPGMSKSILTGVFWPAWAWIRDPGLRFGYWSFDADLTLKKGRDTLELVQSDWYQERWGDIVKLADKDPAAGNFYTTMGGRRFASSIGGKSTGNHFHRQVVDDPIKPQTLSKATLDEAKKFMDTALPSRWARGDRHLGRVIVMQRLHEEDTTGLELLKGGYEHLMLPNEYEPHRACTTSIGFKDPRTVEGELLSPKFFSREALAQMNLSLRDRAAQMQQSPVPAGGNIFQESWFRTWVPAEAKEPKHLSTRTPPRLWVRLPKLDMMWQSWDFAFKDTDTSDFVVGQVWGRAKGQFFLLYQVRGRMGFTDSVKAVKRVTTMFPKARAKLVEDKANGSAVIDTLKQRIIGLIAVNPEGGKEARANAVSPMHEAGNVFYPDSTVSGFEWVDQHESEMTSFPFSKNDDTVDAESQALLWGSAGFKQFTAAMEKLQGKDPAAKHMRELLSRMGGN